MIYPRLKVARDLLTDDGVIFISIDDNEQENLKRVCDEIFGENSFVACFIWQRRTSPDMRKIVSTAHESILLYIKNRQYIDCAICKIKLSEKDASAYSNPDNDPRGPWTSSDFTAQGYRPNQMYEITTPGGKKYSPPEGKCWKNIESEFVKQCSEGRFWFGKDGNGVPRRKTYLSEKEGKNVWTWCPNSEVGHTQEATQEVKKLFDGHAFFDYPKPIRLLHKFLQIGTKEDSIILDFFSGSATTAHAVMQLNAEDGGNRKFIMVQLPELTDEKSEAYKAGYKTICEIGKERIRRAGKKIKEESPLTTQDLDTGFRVLKLDSSNMKEVYYTPAKIVQGELFEQVDNVKSDRTAEDLLFQVMLELDTTLDSKIETEVVAGKTIYNVADCYIVACFDKDVTDEVVTTIAKMYPRYAVLRDTSMATDSTATNFEQLFKTYSPDTTTKIL